MHVCVIHPSLQTPLTLVCINVYSRAINTILLIVKLTYGNASIKCFVSCSFIQMVYIQSDDFGQIACNYQRMYQYWYISCNVCYANCYIYHILFDLIYSPTGITPHLNNH